MKKAIIIGLLILMSLFVGMSFAMEVTIFGPNQYVVDKGIPKIHTDIFSAVPGEARIIVKNGFKNEEQKIIHSVSSAVIRINGEQIFDPNDFNQHVYILEASINLNKENNISVKLASKPDCYLTIELTQEALQPTVNISANPETIYTGESLILSWSSADADIVTIDNGICEVAPSGSMSVSPTETITYTIIATNSVGIATDTVTVNVIQPPTVSISVDPIFILIGEEATLNWNSTNADIVTIDNGIGEVSLSGSMSISPMQTTTYTITAKNIAGTATNTVTLKVTHVSPLPQRSFGKQYEELVPDDATIEKYDEKRFCVITGFVYTRDETGEKVPLSDVTIFLHNHEEYGSARSDEEGRFAIPADGGGIYTVVYEKAGYLQSQRQIATPWSEVVLMEDSPVLIQKDPKTTEIVFNGNPETIIVHESTPVIDERGMRSCTLVFTGDNKAYTNDGRELTTITVSVTEYDTPDSMPAILPPYTIYTYCAEFSVEEAENVSFEKPVIVYVEDFLNFGVGGLIPVGYYDRNRAMWIACKNGLIVNLLDTDSDGIVDALDADGDGIPDDIDNSGSFIDDALGLDNPERYQPNTTYWRVEMNHFSPGDFNWSPSDEDFPPPNPPVPPDFDKQLPGDCINYAGSYEEHRSRIFHEDIPIQGADMTLHYSSHRTSGYDYKIIVPVTGIEDPLCSAISVYVDVAGCRFKESLIPLPNEKVEFVWDGLDFRGKEVYGTLPVSVDITFHYVQGGWVIPVVNRFSDIPPKLLSAGGALFGWPGSGYWTSEPGSVSFRIVSSGGASSIFTFTKSLSRKYYINVQRRPRAEADIAEGWTISNHHHLVRDPIVLSALYKGDGTFIENKKIIKTIAGTGYGGYNGDGIPAIEAYLSEPKAATTDSGCNLYILDGRNKKVRKVGADGILKTVAGGGSDTIDGIPATNAQLYRPTDIAVDNKGNLYIIDYHKVLKVDTNGIINTIVNKGNKIGYAGDGGPATEAWLCSPYSIACDSEGNIYIADGGNHRIRMINTNGIINTIAGDGTAGYSEDGGPAIFASLTPYSIDVDSVGNIYFTDNSSSRIRKISPGGTISTVVDSDASNCKLAIDSQDNLFFVHLHDYVIKIVNKDGDISIVAGNGDHNYGGDGGAPLNASFNPRDVTVDPTGDIFIVDWWDNRVRKVSRSFVFATDTGVLVPDDRDVGYIMSFEGYHQSTIDLSTGKTLYSFSYDDNHRLLSIIDRFSNETTIERSTEGAPLSIISPDGMVTELTIDDNNHLRRVTYQDGSHFDFNYTINGLITDKYEPNSNHFLYQFDNEGKVTDVFDPEGGHWIYHREMDFMFNILASVITGEGNTTTYNDRTFSTGDFTSMITSPTGDITAFNRSADGLWVTKDLSCGTVLQFNYDIDPEYRTSYISRSVEKISSGLNRTILTEKMYEDIDGDDIKDLITNTTIINNRKFIRVNNINDGVEITTSPEGRTLTRQYDPYTLLTESMNMPGFFDITYAYDTKGRLTSITTHTRNTTFTYNAEGLLESITDPENSTTTYIYDPVGRVTGINRPDNSFVGFSYDQNGNITLLTTPSTIDHGFGYNGVNLNASYQTPISGTYTYMYDKDRRLVQTNFPSGRKINNIYDRTWLLQIQTPEGDIDFTYLCGNKVESITKGAESINYGYDSKLIKSEIISGTLNQTLSYTYNNDFNMTSFTYAGDTTNYLYDKDQLLINEGAYTIIRNAQNGLPEAVTGGTLNLTRTFNGYGEAEWQDLTVNASNISSWSLSRDNVGKITAKSETMGGINSYYQYAYDPIGRLLTVTKDDTLIEEYKYGPSGIRIYEMNALRGISGRSFTYSDEDHLLKAGTTIYHYDVDGFLTEKTQGTDITAYDYSSRGELLRVDLPDDKVIEYLYDPLGRRIAKKVNGVITEKYLWQGLTQLLAIYDNTDRLLMRFEYADARMPVAMTSGSSTYYLSYDQVGSLRIIADSSGNVIKRIDYDSFGNIITDSNPMFKVPFGFAGGLQDRDTGLVRFGYRDYDPDTGRWTAKDPILFAGSDIDLYGYCVNDPINWVDPLGLIDVGPTGIVGGAIGGSIAGAIMGAGYGWSKGGFVGLLTGLLKGGFIGAFTGAFTGAITGSLMGSTIAASCVSATLGAPINEILSPTSIDQELQFPQYLEYRYLPPSPNLCPL